MSRTFKLFLVLLFALCFHQSFAQVTLTATVGTSTGSFTTLKGAFDAINAGTHKGVVVIKINSSTLESASAALNASGSGSASYNSINIYPTTTGLSISGALATPLINLNGCDNVTIDGRVNATGSTKSLTITNTSSASTVGTSTIRFIGDASTNTVQYCTLKGSSTDAAAGILFFSTATTTGNDNNTITNNDITCAADASRPLNAIYALGTSAKNNDNNTISNNNFYNFLSKGTASQGINIGSYNSGYTISGNSFYETASFAATVSVAYNVILISAATGTGNGFTVSGNYIGGNTASCGGTAWTKTALNNAFTAISVTTATGTANSIQGNTIQNINWTNDGTSDFTGIYLSGATVANIGTVTGNTIGAATGTGSISFTSTTTATDFWGINIASTDVVSCQNNTIGSITVANASTNATNFYGIYKSASAGTTTISNNSIGSESTANSINASSASSTAANIQSVYGINSAGSGAVTISDNTIANMANGTSNATTTATGLISGIYVSAGTNTVSNNTIYNLSNANANNTIVNTASVTGIAMANATAAAQTISGNTIYNLSNSYSSFTGGVIGIYYSGSTTASTVKGNFIYGLSVSGTSSTTADLYGIKIAAGATTYSNNIISLGGNTTTDVFGIYETGAASNNNSLFFNTIYIGGSLASSATNTSYSIYSAVTTNTRDFRNNVLINARSTASGTSKHFALYIVTSGGTITCNYNNYYVSGTGGVLGYYAANKTALPIVTSNDANSIITNPSLSNAGGTTASDYIPTHRGTGVTGTGVTVDYDGNTRLSNVTMGAFEYFLPPVISSFSPTSAKPGDAVTITGAHFNTTAANNIVFFGATQATVTAASATSLSLTVPTGASYAPITVLNTGTVLSGATLSNFNPTFSPAKSSITSTDIVAKVDFTAGTTPYDVAIGDLDGDGKPDLVVANNGSNTVSVFRNTSSSGSISSSSFAAKVDFTTGTYPYSVALGDIDGDGKLDLAVSNKGSNTVSVFRNTSTSGSISSSSFAAKVDFTTGTSPYKIAIGDLDGDGKTDLSVANYSSNTVSVFRNTSTSGSISLSSFAAKVDFTTGTSPYSVAIGDLDGDGKLDLAVSNNAAGTSASISVFRNTSNSGSISSSSFASKVDFSTGAYPIYVAIGDLDSDSKPDLIVALQGAASYKISIFRNTSTSGTIDASSFATNVDFTTGQNPQSVAIGDLNGDAKPDLVVGNNQSHTVSIMRNTSTSGSITSSSFATKVDFLSGAYPISVAIGDFDMDGKLDITNANNSGFSILRNADCTNPTSGGTIAGAQSGVSGFDPAAFTSSAAASGNSGTLEYKWQSSTTSSSTGFSDIASSNSATYDAGAVTQTTWFKRLARVSCNVDWTGAVESNVLVAAIRPVISSFTPASAKPGNDVTLTGTDFNSTANYNIVFFGATQATVTAVSATSLTATVPTGATYGPISLLNFENGASAASLSYFNPIYSPAKAAIGTEDIDTKVDFTAGTNPSSVSIGDLDGDGKPDLAVANYIANTVSVFRNTSTSGAIAASSFATKVDFTTGSNPISVAIGDLDGDGKLDLVVVNNNSNMVSIFRNTSTSGSIDASSFAAKVDFSTGTYPSSVAIGDLDGDGKLDLALANNGASSVSILRNTSVSGSIVSSSFSTKVDYTTGASPNSVAIGDLDGDSKPDLAVTNYSSTSVSVLRNTSTSGSIVSGSFATKVDFTTGTSPNSVAIGDLDGDGKADLAVVNSLVGSGGNTVSVLRNTSTSGSIVSGSFAAKVDFTTGIAPNSVAIGDLDGDGKLDLSVASYSSTMVSVFRNISTSGTITASSFAAKVNFRTGNGAYSVAIGDLDGDSKPDLVVANYGGNSVSVLRNSDCTSPTSGGIIVGVQVGNIGFNPAAFTSSVAASGNSGTLEYKWQSSTTSNSTGFSDIASSNSTTYDAGALTVTTWYKRLARVSCKSDWTGAVESNVLEVTINPPPVITLFSPISAKPGDAVTLNGSGFNTTTSNNIVFLGATKATVTAVTSTSLSLTVPNGAIYAPITVLNTGNALTGASLSNFNPIYIPAKSGITTADISAKVDFTTGSTPYSVAIGDLDGDGKPDLAIANYNSNTISIFRNTSSNGNISATSFSTKVDFATGNNPSSIAIGDVDGDGKPDLAVGNYNSSNVSVFRNTSTSGSITTNSFAAKVDFTTGSGPSSVAICDLEGDGKLDLVIVNYGASSVSVLRNTSTSGSIGSGSFAAKVDFTVGAGPYSGAIGDLDGDGKPDLAVANYYSNSVSVFRNISIGSIASTSFAAKVDFTTGTYPYSVAIGDLDGDGKSDLSVANNVSNSVSVLRNTSTSGSIGSGSFAAKVDFTTGSNPQSVAIGDLDGDGKPDLAVANNVSNSVSVLRNTSTSGSIGSGSFAAKVDFTTGTNPYSVAIGDLDGDGKPDLVLANSGASNVSVMRNADVSTLPVTITHLQASKQQLGINLDWKAENEISVDKYIIERSRNGIQFEAIGSTIALGNNGSTNVYRFIDALPSNGKNYYRIKAIDKSGASHYTNIVFINLDAVIVGIGIYPNPISSGSFMLKLQGMSAGQYSIQLLNNQGQQILTKEFKHWGGSTTLNVHLPTGLSAGMYFIRYMKDNVVLKNEKMVVE